MLLLRIFKKIIQIYYYYISNFFYIELTLFRIFILNYFAKINLKKIYFVRKLINALTNIIKKIDKLIKKKLSNQKKRNSIFKIFIINYKYL